MVRSCFVLVRAVFVVSILVSKSGFADRIKEMPEDTGLGAVPVWTNEGNGREFVPIHPRSKDGRVIARGANWNFVFSGSELGPRGRIRVGRGESPDTLEDRLVLEPGIRPIIGGQYFVFLDMRPTDVEERLVPVVSVQDSDGPSASHVDIWKDHSRVFLDTRNHRFGLVQPVGPVGEEEARPNAVVPFRVFSKRPGQLFYDSVSRVLVFQTTDSFPEKILVGAAVRDVMDGRYLGFGYRSGVFKKSPHQGWKEVWLDVNELSVTSDWEEHLVDRLRARRESSSKRSHQDPPHQALPPLLEELVAEAATEAGFWFEGTGSVERMRKLTPSEEEIDQMGGLTLFLFERRALYHRALSEIERATDEKTRREWMWVASDSLLQYIGAYGRSVADIGDSPALRHATWIAPLSILLSAGSWLVHRIDSLGSVLYSEVSQSLGIMDWAPEASLAVIFAVAAHRFFNLLHRKRLKTEGGLASVGTSLGGWRNPFRKLHRAVLLSKGSCGEVLEKPYYMTPYSHDYHWGGRHPKLLVD